jgi:predicted Zn-dependent peptidase
LERAKNLIEAAFIFEQEDAGSQASLLGETEFYYGYQQLYDYVRETRSVTKNDIQRIIGVYFRPGNRTVGWLVPVK